MENPEKSQNKGGQTRQKAADAIGRHWDAGEVGGTGRGFWNACALRHPDRTGGGVRRPTARSCLLTSICFVRSVPGGHPSRFCPSVVASTAFPESPARPARFPGIPRRPMASAAFCRVLVDECGG